MPLKTRIFHEISAVCNRRSNLSEIPISNQSQNPTRDDEANANRRTQTAPRPSPFRGLFFRDWRLPYAL